MTSFVPRAAFPALDSLPRSYYLGHHAAGLAKMKTMLNQIDFVIECRDYRIPLTSRNPQFEEVLSGWGRERIVVYTKTDLASGDQMGKQTSQEKAKEQKVRSPASYTL
jgi:mitochondrial GTPase 1